MYCMYCTSYNRVNFTRRLQSYLIIINLTSCYLFLKKFKIFKFLQNDFDLFYKILIYDLPMVLKNADNSRLYFLLFCYFIFASINSTTAIVSFSLYVTSEIK